MTLHPELTSLSCLSVTLCPEPESSCTCILTMHTGCRYPAEGGEAGGAEAGSEGSPEGSPGGAEGSGAGAADFPDDRSSDTDFGEPLRLCQLCNFRTYKSLIWLQLHACMHACRQSQNCVAALAQACWLTCAHTS